jgi:hypothetical protein
MNVLEREATEAELVALGFSRCFIADEPRLSEAVALYQELGYDVRLLPAIALGRDGCQRCLDLTAGREMAIFIRRPKARLFS